MDQLVVVLHRRDRIADFIPYIAAVARPGMTISVLLHYASDEFQEVMDQLIKAAGPSHFGQARGEQQPNFATSFGRGRAMLSDLSALHRPGLEFRVSLYTGNPRNALLELSNQQPAGLLVMRGGASCAITRVLRGVRWFERLLSRASRGASVVLAQS